ncbi:MAG TPA: FecR domain-containing protein, partial [Oxalicibacterium sp.]|nr:FecR domain-containing protein [Oxalicibacterium sp.]
LQPEPGSIAVNAAGIVYYAQAGDTLMGIAQRLTGKSANWQALGKINRVDKDIRIPIGTGIVIPTEMLPDQPSEATVIARSGNVTVSNGDGTPVSIDIGTKLVEGARITTSANSFVTLQLPDASRISLPSNSSIELATLRKSQYTGAPRTELKLTRGKVVSRVSPLNANKGRYEVHTPLSVAGVRGTFFRVGLNDRKASNEVLDGHVLVGSPQTPDTRMLDSAKGNVVDAKTVGPAIDLLPAPQLASEPYRRTGAAQFALTPIDGARAYHVQIAQDAEMLNLLAEATGNANISIDNIPEGNYFIRVSAIDRYGLEGLPAVFAAAIRNRNQAPDTLAVSTPSVVHSDSREMVLHWAGAANQKYNVQVARDAEFSWLQFTTTVTGTEARFPRPSFGTYFARVQRVHADGSTSPFSLAQTLIVTDQWIINDGRPAMSREGLSRSAVR